MKLKTTQSEPGYVSVRQGALQQTKARLKARDKSAQLALEALQKASEEARRVEPPHVTQKTRFVPGSTKHDYVSIAPYLWPDPKKNDGLPYIRRDGQVNPESRDPASSDLRRLEKLSQTVETLALGFFFTGNPAYAEHAVRCLRVWFIDPQTRMNPHLNFGQGVPGESTGRAAGVIEGGNLVGALDAAGLLEGSSHWSKADQEALRGWAEAYLTWLQTSEIGKKEGAMEQNHGTLYDGQVVRLALLLGKKELAKRVCESVGPRRIAVQVEPDGSQPLELKRTKSFSYSRLNLLGLLQLATLAERAGVDLWHYQSPKGGSIKKALEFLLPYILTPPKKWPYEQLTGIGPADFALLLRLAALGFKEATFEQVLQGIPEARSQRFVLVYPTESQR